MHSTGLAALPKSGRRGGFHVTFQNYPILLSTFECCLDCKVVDSKRNKRFCQLVYLYKMKMLVWEKKAR